MGEARRRKLAGTYPAQERADFLAALHEMLAQEPDGSTVSGVTYFPPHGHDDAHRSR